MAHSTLLRFRQTSFGGAAAFSQGSVALTLALVALATLALPSPGQAQYTADYIPPAAQGETFPLSIRSIMRAEAIVGQAPGSVRWSADSETIYFNWVPGGNEWDADREWYKVSAEGGEPVRLTEAEEDDLGRLTATGEISPDGEWELISLSSDLWLRDRDSREMTRLTETRAGEGGATWSGDGSEIFYTQDSNLFAMSVETGRVRQLTDIRSGSPPSFEADEEDDAQRRFLIDQQRELFEFIRRQAEREEAQRQERAAAAGEPTEGLQVTWVPNGKRVGQLEANGDASFIALSAFSGGGGGTESTPVPFWITDSGYTEPRNTRSKVGDSDPNGGSEAGVLSTATGEVIWFDAKPEDFEGEVSTSLRGWNDAGTHVLISGSSDDDQNRWYWTVDAATGERTLIDHLFDEAWVGGPCGNCAGWYPDSDRVWYVSEASGFAQLYAVNADGSAKERLTEGEWELQSVQILDADRAAGRERFWVTTNEDSPFNTHQGWLPFDGGEIEYLTQGEGRYDVDLSPDLERAAVLYQVANHPAELYVAGADGTIDFSDGGTGARVTETPTEEWLSFDWIRPEIVRVPAEDGAMVPGRIYRPEDLGAESNGAAVIFVHGAGYLQNVHNGFSTYYREYMFNHFLAANGYTVLDLDYRASSGYGRDWRTAIYRFMGGKDLSDQVDGARWLVANEGIDADRIGLYGGSYGGFITLMGLFTAGDTFKAGAALRSVTDWAHYNDGYTSNILNDPQEDEEAYRVSSPIYHAEGFGPDQYLLMPHGMVDTNVHFSDVVRLSQRLIELGKENWELAVYPVENHGFVVPSSWTDEYRRIFELFERTMSEPGCTENGGLCSVPGR